MRNEKINYTIIKLSGITYKNRSYNHIYIYIPNPVTDLCAFEICKGDLAKTAEEKATDKTGNR